MKKPRFIQRIVALLKGNFWIPCPICGQMFGGHEWSGKALPTFTPGLFRGVCPDCENIKGVV